MAAALTSLGASVDTSGDDWAVTPGRCRAPPRSTAAWPATVMRFVPPVAALADGTVAFDGDPHARTRPMGEILVGLRGLGVEVDDEGRGTLPFTCTARAVRGGQVVIDASASQPVHLGAAPRGCAVRRGRRRPPRRQAGALAAPHRHDGGRPARARRRGRRQRADRWRVLPGPVRAVDVDDRARPVQRRAVRRRGRGDRGPRSPCSAGRGPRPRPATGCARCSASWGRRSRSTTRPHRDAAPGRCGASTSTCTTSASSPRPWPPWPRWPTRPRCCAASPTSAATRPTGSLRCHRARPRLGGDVTERP